MVFSELCPPALIYLVFSITQVVIDTVKGMYNTALMKIWVAIVFTILLNYLCSLGLGIVSWFIVFVPFILMTVIVTILLLMFGLDPASGKMKIKKTDTKKDDILDYYKKKGYDLGGGNGTDNIDKVEEDKEEEVIKEKEKKILSRTLLLYKDKLEGDDITNFYKKLKVNGNTVFEKSDQDFDLRDYRKGVATISNILFGMGEQDIATFYKNKSNSCIDDITGMKKEQKKNHLQKCQTELLDDVKFKFSPEMKLKFEKNLEDRFPKKTKLPSGVSVN